MKVKEFNRSIYWALSHRGTNLFVSDLNLLRFVDYAVKDILNYEGVQWSFMYRNDIKFTTPGEGGTFSFEIQNPTKEYLRRLFEVKADGVKQEPLKLRRSVDEVSTNGGVFFNYWGTTIVVDDKRSTEYTVGYTVGFTDLLALEDELPLPSYFYPALFDFTMSYVMLPFGQYGEWKDQNFYERGQQKLQQVLKSNSSQGSNLTFNIR